MVHCLVAKKYNVNVLSLDGLSTDTKPIRTYIEYGSDGREVGRMGIPNGSLYTEIDTGDTYMYDADNTTWHKVTVGGGGGGTQGGIVLVGETTTRLVDNATTNPITVDGQSYTAQPNDAVIYGNKEFLFVGTKWHEFGDLSGLSSKDIGAMTNYAKAQTGAAIATTDTLNQAIGKVEKRVEVNENNILNIQTTITGLNAENTVVATTKPTNLIKEKTLINGKYVDTNGAEKTSSAFSVTPYIEVTSGTALHGANIGLSCFYSASREFISNVSSWRSAVTVPQNAKYIRVDIPAASVNYAILSDIGGLPNYNDHGIITLNKNKRYTSGWTVFTVPVNQAIVGTADTGSTISDSESDIVNVSCALKLPTSYTPYGKPTKLIMICHGAGRGITIPPPTPEGAKAWKDMANYNNICNAFLGAGYAVFDCDGYANTYNSCNFWGASKGVEAWRKAYDYIVSNYNVEENFSIYGFSMGGLTAMHLALNGFPNIKCIALGSPVLDLEKCWEDGQTYAFINAYGMTDHYDPDKARGCDPMQRLVTINGTEYCLAVLPPIKMWYGSTEEGTAVNKTYAERYVNALVASGQYAIYREVTGAGHEICYGENAMCIQEYLYWIDRFNNKE